MTTTKKLLQAAAGNAGGLKVEDVFSTYLFSANNSTQTITNGIDLDGEGGLVWLKSRTNAYHHGLYDTERGVNRVLYSGLSNGEGSTTNLLNSFNSDGFTLGQNENSNFSSGASVSWTFRKAPKFFTCLTYTGNGSTGARSIGHSLESTPGFVIIKRTDSTGDWTIGHTNVQYPYYLLLNTTDSKAGGSVTGKGYIYFNSSNFTVWSGGDAANDLNLSGASYVAYLFANHNGDGEFGPSGDQDIIKCGNYFGNSSSDGPVVNLGFEPQWLLVKNVNDGSEGWAIHDSARDASNPRTAILRPNTNETEADNSGYSVDFNSTGFQIKNSNGTWNANGQEFIYVALRAAE